MSTAANSVAIRHSVRRLAPQLRPQQRRWARVHDIRFVATHQSLQERIIDKYKNKLDKKAKEEGHESISSLKEAYKDQISEHRRRTAVLTAGALSKKQAPVFHQQQPPPPPIPQSQAALTGSPKRKSATVPGIKPLSSYLDLEKVSPLPNKEIEYIWRIRHANDPLSLCAVIPLATYTRIYNTAKSHPQFILPLPRAPAVNGERHALPTSPSERKTAADIHYMQWSFHPPSGPPPSPNTKTANTHTSTVLFTHLAAFKLHGEYAPPHTTVTHHLDLADSHGLVLLNGSVSEGRGVSVEEGRWLLMCLQKFYDFEGHGGGIGKEKRQGLLKKFSKGDQGFDLEELVDEAERVS